MGRELQIPFCFPPNFQSVDEIGVGEEMVVVESHFLCQLNRMKIQFFLLLFKGIDIEIGGESLSMIISILFGFFSGTFSKNFKSRDYFFCFTFFAFKHQKFFFLNFFMSPVLKHIFFVFSFQKKLI